MTSKTVSPQTMAQQSEGLFASSTFLFSAIANKQTQLSSRRFRQEFGLGISEWRCIAMMVAEGPVSAVQICAAGGMSKSLASRALARLQRLDYIVPCPGPQKPLMLKLTDSGMELFKAMFGAALEMETASMEGLSACERQNLLHLLKRVYQNVEMMISNQ